MLQFDELRNLGFQVHAVAISLVYLFYIVPILLYNFILTYHTPTLTRTLNLPQLTVVTTTHEVDAVLMEKLRKAFVLD